MVGLVLVEVISNLGSSASYSSVLAVARPIAVSFGLVVVLLLCGRFVVKPRIRNGWQTTTGSPFLGGVSHDHAAFISQTMILFGFVTGATYAGTSGLFAAYLAGLSLGWCDSERSIASTIGDRRTSLEETCSTGRRGRTMLSIPSNTTQLEEGRRGDTDDASLQSLQSIRNEESSPIEQPPSRSRINESASTLGPPVYGFMTDITRLWWKEDWCLYSLFVQFPLSFLAHSLTPNRPPSVFLFLSDGCLEVTLFGAAWSIPFWCFGGNC